MNFGPVFENREERTGAPQLPCEGGLLGFPDADPPLKPLTLALRHPCSVGLTGSVCAAQQTENP